LGKQDKNKTPHQLIKEMWAAKDDMEEFIAECSKKSSFFSRGGLSVEEYVQSLKTDCNEIRYGAARIQKLADQLSHSIPRTPKKSKNHALTEFTGEVQNAAKC
jgi:hypothetical protein